MAINTVEKLPVIKKPDFALLEKVVFNTISPILGRRVEDLFDIQEELGATQEFVSRYRLGHFGVIAEAPHTGHPDPVGVMKKVRRIKEAAGAEGILVPISVTLINGKQGKPTIWYKALVPYMNLNDIDPLPVATANDYRREIAISPNPETTKHRLDSLNATATRRIMQARRNNQIIYTLPEGTVQPGRKDEHGRLHGMQRIEDVVLARILGRNIEGRGDNAEDFVVLPIGSWGTENLLNPKTYKVDWRVWIQLLRPPFVLPFQTFASKHIGPPFGKSEYKSHLIQNGRLEMGASDKQLAEFMQAFPETFFDFLMGERIAPMVPKEYRGVYDAASW